MSATGQTTISFGSFPGSVVASVAVTGQTGITGSSLVEAWLDPTQAATADHSPDEHLSADLDIRCESIVGGTGFTIYAYVRSSVFAYGAWNVSWVWN